MYNFFHYYMYNVTAYFLCVCFNLLIYNNFIKL